MSQNLSSAAVVIGAVRVKHESSSTENYISTMYFASSLKETKSATMNIFSKKKSFLFNSFVKEE